MSAVYRIVLYGTTFGLLTRGGYVVKAPPIAFWTVGKSSAYVLGYYRRRGAEVSEVA